MDLVTCSASSRTEATIAVAAILAPAIINYSLARVCPVGKGDCTSEKTIPFRPPKWVFATVWPILYALLGTSLYFSLQDPASLSLHSAIVLLLAWWIPVNSCWGMKKEGVWILVACALACSYAMIISKRAALLLAPLLVWVSFAVLMSAWSVAAQANAAQANAAQ